MEIGITVIHLGNIIGNRKLMTFKEFIVKIKKRVFYRIFNFTSIETYYLRVKNITTDETQFDYNNQIIYARNKNSSDYSVLKQVLIDKEYYPCLSFFLINNIQPNIIIDAGANIGATTVFIKGYFPLASVICIEPDSQNLVMLHKNLSNYVSNGSVKILPNGLMGKSQIKLKVTNNFRDKKEWGRQVEEYKGGEIESVTIPEIIKQYNLSVIDLLKIDIEGSESFLTDLSSDVSFLDITRCIAIEIHDEFGIREDIYKLLKSKGFILIEVNETVIGVKVV
jgi:FkbM family methyltransferase